MMADRIRVVLVGCGGVARTYREVYSTHERVEVVATCDVELEHARAAAGGAAGALVTTDAAEALSVAADLAVISTPNDLHLRQAVTALRGGMHVLLQKPIARTSAEAREILTVADEVGRRVGLYMSGLDHPLVHDVRDAVRSGWFGTVAKMRLALAHLGGLKQPAGSWRTSARRSGGGSFLLLAPHLVHLAQWISGQPIVNIVGSQARVAADHIEGDDVSSVVGTFGDRSALEISTGWCFTEHEVAVYGTDGTIRYLDQDLLVVKGNQPLDGRMFDYTDVGRTQRFTGLVPPPMGERANPYEQHRAAIQSVLDDTPFPVPGADGLRDLEIIENVQGQVPLVGAR